MPDPKADPPATPAALRAEPFTDPRAAPFADPATEPAFVLVRPQMGENIGAAARAMWNFELSRLRLVDPRDGWPNPRAVALAAGASPVLDRAGRFASTAEAVADCTHVYATTARGRDLAKPVLTPEAAMAEARALTAQGARVAILFGAERAGLENADIALASAIATVPVNPAFYSLNLAQCVLLMAYEWRRAALPPQPPPGPPGRTTGRATPDSTSVETASVIEVERLSAHMEQRLEAAGFFFPASKAAWLRLNLRNMWGRLPLTRGDVQVLHGILRQLTRGGARPLDADRDDA